MNGAVPANRLGVALQGHHVLRADRHVLPGIEDAAGKVEGAANGAGVDQPVRRHELPAVGIEHPVAGVPRGDRAHADRGPPVGPGHDGPIEETAVLDLRDCLVPETGPQADPPPLRDALLELNDRVDEPALVLLLHRVRRLGPDAVEDIRKRNKTQFPDEPPTPVAEIKLRDDVQLILAAKSRRDIPLHAGGAPCAQRKEVARSRPAAQARLGREKERGKQVPARRGLPRRRVTGRR